MRGGVAPAAVSKACAPATARSMSALAAIGDVGEDLAVDRRDLGEGRAAGGPT